MSVSNLISKLNNPIVSITLPSGESVDVKSYVPFNARMEVTKYYNDNKSNDAFDVQSVVQLKMVSNVLSCSYDEAKRLSEVISVDDWLFIIEHCECLYYPDVKKKK